MSPHRFLRNRTMYHQRLLALWAIIYNNGSIPSSCTVNHHHLRIERTHSSLIVDMAKTMQRWVYTLHEMTQSLGSPFPPSPSSFDIWRGMGQHQINTLFLSFTLRRFTPSSNAIRRLRKVPTLTCIPSYARHRHLTPSKFHHFIPQHSRNSFILRHEIHRRWTIQRFEIPVVISVDDDAFLMKRILLHPSYERTHDGYVSPIGSVPEMKKNVTFSQGQWDFVVTSMCIAKKN
mmetsp:Transcript_15959/g.33716  ORF Transcript_15959/g.33716 Transcript_15959/m.33716 type:complete len:232 (+) Transcript_15959:148-843(+)